MAIAASQFSVSTPMGTSKSGHGISFMYNRANVSKADRAKREARRLSNRAKRVDWTNDSKTTSLDLVKLIHSGYRD